MALSSHRRWVGRLRGAARQYLLVRDVAPADPAGLAPGLETAQHDDLAHRTGDLVETRRELAHDRFQLAGQIVLLGDDLARFARRLPVQERRRPVDPFDERRRAGIARGAVLRE